MSSTVEKIKENLGIVDVVSSYIKVEKSGSNFKAKCPFHNEKTPSFFLSPTRSTFYCFGCGEKGDIFTFVEQFEGLDFQGALKVLGERAGVPIVFENKNKRDQKEILYKILEETTKFFEENLKKQTSAKKYLKERGLEDKFLERFKVGYALDKWNSLYDHLKQYGFEEKDIERAGLIKKGEKGFYDRFRSRIIFPIADSSGRIVAFSGRIFPEQNDIAKYLNSPETELFNKSKILYGFDNAKLSIRKSNFSIVVEGQMDLVMSHQAGFTNTVALSGTALTNHHVNILTRLSTNIVLAFDADSAGIASSGRSAEIAIAEGMDVKIAKIPKGVDPADLVKKDPKLLNKAIKESQHIIDFYLDIIEEKETDKRIFGRKVEQIVLPFVARIPSKIDQMHFISRVAGRLGVDKDVIIEEVSKIPIESEYVENKSENKKENVNIKKSRKETVQEKLFGILLWQKSLKKSDINTESLEENLKNILGKENFKKYFENKKEFEQNILFLTEIGYEDKSILETDIEDLLGDLKKEHLKDDYENALIELRMAEQKGDEKLVVSKLKECKKLSEKINSLKSKIGGQN